MKFTFTNPITVTLYGDKNHGIAHTELNVTLPDDIKTRIEAEFACRPCASWILEYPSYSNEFRLAAYIADELFELSNSPYREDDRKAFWGRNRSLSVGDSMFVTVNGTTVLVVCKGAGWGFYLMTSGPKGAVARAILRALEDSNEGYFGREKAIESAELATV